jgi:hypothetical protein
MTMSPDSGGRQGGIMRRTRWKRLCKEDTTYKKWTNIFTELFNQ